MWYQKKDKTFLRLDYDKYGVEKAPKEYVVLAVKDGNVDVIESFEKKDEATRFLEWLSEKIGSEHYFWVKYSEYEKVQKPLDFNSFQEKVSNRKYYPLCPDKTDEKMLKAIEKDTINQLQRYAVLIETLVKEEESDFLKEGKRKDIIGFLVTAAGRFASLYGMDLEECARRYCDD